MEILVQNRKVGFNYEIIDKIEAGVMLLGWQVKSIKAKHASIVDAFAFVHKGEMWLRGVQISMWKTMGEFEKQKGSGDIKLLLNRSEIEKLAGKITNTGNTLVPTKLFAQRGFIKVELALAKGLKRFDKRAKLKEKQQKKDIDRELKQSNIY